MNILNKLNEELSLVYGKQRIVEYKKWRRPKQRKSSSKKYLMVIDQLSTAVQVYDKSIKYVADQNTSQVLTSTSKHNIIMLLDEFDKQLDIINKQSINLDEEEFNEINEKIKITKQNNEEAKKVLNKDKVFKLDISKILNYLQELVTAKITKGAFQALALSNPLTAVIYQNWDIPKGVYNAIRKS